MNLPKGLASFSHSWKREKDLVLSLSPLPRVGEGLVDIGYWELDIFLAIFKLIRKGDSGNLYFLTGHLSVRYLGSSTPTLIKVRIVAWPNRQNRMKSS